MTDIIFSFDTEDFTSNKAADGILREAEILKKHGVRGSFCLVGLLAEQLEKWGRNDVLDALKFHEINCHTYGHTLHPMINEYTDTEDFFKAYNEVIRQETKAVDMIKKATGAKKLYAAVPPGNQKSYAAMYAYADMGIPVYADTFCDTENGDGVYYCNIFHVEYAYCLEQHGFNGSEEDFRAVLDGLAKRKRAVVYTHPNQSLFDEWWDILNYDKENLVPFGEWKNCHSRSEEESERFFNNLDLFVSLVKNDSRFRIVNYADVAEELAKEPERVISLKDIPALRRSLSEEFFPVTSPASFSLSDIFYACAELLNGKEKHICKKTYGLLYQPFAVRESFTVTADEMKKSAENINTAAFIPEKIAVGDKYLGPADWLTAALDILCGEDFSLVVPKKQMPSLDRLPQVRDCAFKGTWRHSDTFEDNYLSERLRLQSWTMRFK